MQPAIPHRIAYPRGPFDPPIDHSRSRIGPARGDATTPQDWNGPPQREPHDGSGVADSIADRAAQIAGRSSRRPDAPIDAAAAVANAASARALPNGCAPNLGRPTPSSLQPAPGRGAPDTPGLTSGYGVRPPITARNASP